MQQKFQIAALFLALTLPGMLAAQRLFTRDAKVHFDATSKNSPERVGATNKSGTLVVDIAAARVESAVLMTNVLFEKALMQEHFNENYVESAKYPKSTFKGKIDVFPVTLSDYGISIPSVVSDKLGAQARISIDAALEPLKK